MALTIIDPETATRHLGFRQRLLRWFERNRLERHGDRPR
jgi:hypothetical protein